MLEDKIESWYKHSGRKIIVFLAVIGIVYVALRMNILGLFAPFIIAWLFATLLNPVVSWLAKRLKVPRGIGTILSMISILSGLLGVITVLIKKLWEQIINFASTLPTLTDEIILQINSIEEKLGEKIHILPGGEGIMNLDALIEQILNSISSFLTSAIPTIYDAISKVPDIVLFIVVMFLATFFMTKDYYRIKDFVKAQFSDTIVDRIVIMQRGMIEAIAGYIRTQVILMSMTFSICLVGLFIFRLDYALLLSVIIGFVDALPVFGSGTILIPWAIYNVLTGDLTLAIGLICIYGIIFITRQIMEPKILSTQIGIYALVTVMAVYVGYRSIGVLGMILGPVVVVTFQMLQNVGVLPKFKPVNKLKQKGECNEKYSDNSNC